MAVLNYSQPNRNKPPVLSTGNLSLTVTSANFKNDKEIRLTVGEDPHTVLGTVSVQFAIRVEQGQKAISIMAKVAEFLEAISDDAVDLQNPQIQNYGDVVSVQFQHPTLYIEQVE
ncbi:hypothetical protein CPT_Slocum_163 [Serratia phage Slocum]|nr:hypothetical protein CPT_Slocum_163 [Serratia phage Slocum]URC22547.1 hypothetical protein KAMAJI_01190 [Serratia phage vB_SmaM-Kamaji]